MNPSGLFLKALSTEEAFERLLALAVDFFGADAAELALTTGIAGLSVTVTAQANALYQADALVKLRALCKQRPHIICASAALTHITRQGQQPARGFAITYQSADAVVGQITFATATEPQRLPLAVEFVEKHFSVTTYVDLVHARGGEATESAALQIRERASADIERTLDKMGTLLASLTEREMSSRKKLQEDLESTYAARLQKLDEEYRARDATLVERARQRDEAFDAERKAFDLEVQEHNIKDAKVVRRALLKKIEEVLEKLEAFSVSEATAQKRTLIHRVSWGLIVVTLLLLITFAALLVYLVVERADLHWYLFAPLTAALAAFGTTAVYYLKWNDRWFREHADGEFAAKRYKADILRASWIAELVSELAKEGVHLPHALVDAFTRNLFHGGTASRVSEHPMDHIADVLKNLKTVQIGDSAIRMRTERTPEE